MTDKTTPPCLQALDLGDVARIVQAVFPDYSLCECARMVAVLVPTTGCVCSLCAPGIYPDCVRDIIAPPGDAASAA
ncbi:hypothetical protein DK847_02855 [Aestuariivirga litoralis]|uniref:Uncharacterized protein n=1 Tax=Aestuariivirga litoralis TaxID=2650924 RepID=A0A2W2BSV1_9HYPH|nr:hypothetical protein [Aestuariivirga litoralis]PZF78757.1 hypothetical protein DK847_02855 [Aestuariivirga litoralis]